MPFAVEGLARDPAVRHGPMFGRAGEVEKTKLDRVLSGSPSALGSAAKELKPSTRDAFVAGARQGIAGGFSDVMWLIAAVGAAGAMISFWMLGPDQKRTSR